MFIQVFILYLISNIIQVDFLEMENQRLQNELETYKKEKLKLKRAINRNNPIEYVPIEEKETIDENNDELPKYRPKEQQFARYNTDSNASSLADSIVGDLDPETMERAALTESVCYIQTKNIKHNFKLITILIDFS